MSVFVGGGRQSRGRDKIKLCKSIAIGAAGLALVAFAGSANATTKDFTYSDSGSTVATGSFSYATGDTGVLGYGDLSAFSVTVNSVTYDLAEVNTLTDYVYFGYDTASNTFVTNPNTCGFAGCGFQSSLSAINSSGNYGFFFNPVPGEYSEYSSPITGSIDGLKISNGGVPEPASWALMLLGVGGVGAVLRTRRRKAVAA